MANGSLLQPGGERRGKYLRMAGKLALGVVLLVLVVVYRAHVFPWLGGIIKSFMPWPAIAIAVLFHPKFGKVVDLISRSFKTIEVAGVKVGLNPDIARKTRLASSEIVEEDIKEKYDQLVVELKIQDKFRRLVDETIKPMIKAKTTIPIKDVRYRATIHIGSVLYKEQLYQLVEYYPSPTLTAQKRGRRISIRFGIVGKSWRLGRTCYDPEVSTDPVELVEKWGMTLEEGEKAGLGQQSFLSVPVKDDVGDLLAIIFVDVEHKNAFGPGAADTTEALGETIGNACDELDLRAALISVREKMKKENDFQLS